MRYLALSLLIAGLVALGGCARGESPDTPPTLYAEMTVSGEINPAYDYFLVLGTDQNDNSGPVPVAAGTAFGNGFSVIEPAELVERQKPPFYVVYGLEAGGTFAQFRLNRTTGDYEPLGLPYRFGVRDSDDGRPNATLWIEIDQRDLEPVLDLATDPVVQLNWISMNDIDLPVGEKQYDGIGDYGKSYVTPIPLKTQAVKINGVDTFTTERSFGEGDIPAFPNPDLDINNWRIEVRVGNLP